MPDFWASYLTKTPNNETDGYYQFPDKLKLANITIVLGKEDRNLAKSYRIVALLWVISKIFQRKLKKSVLYW